MFLTDFFSKMTLIFVIKSKLQLSNQNIGSKFFISRKIFFIKFPTLAFYHTFGKLLFLALKRCITLLIYTLVEISIHLKIYAL